MTKHIADVTAEEPKLSGQEHWPEKDGIKLFLWEKRRAPDTDYRGTILFIHGSSWASLATFDLHMPGRPYSSVMDWFAVRGFDCWCLDNEGYGRSDKHRDSTFGIETGADDIAAATDYILKLRKLENITALRHLGRRVEIGAVHPALSQARGAFGARCLRVDRQGQPDAGATAENGTGAAQVQPSTVLATAASKACSIAICPAPPRPA